MSVTRRELFNMVWSEPVTRVCKLLGLSDRGLGKLCARYDIPVPPRGYWARRSAGYQPTKPSLPIAKRNAEERINLTSKAKLTAASAAAMEVEASQPTNSRIVASNNKPRHSLVRLTGEALRASTKDQYGRLWGGPGVLDVRVAKPSIARALTILDALLRAVEDRGHGVSVKDRKSVLTVDGETIEFGLDERSMQTERPLSEKERLELARGGYVYGRYSYVPSGELSFHLRHAYWSRNKWSDRKKLKLEGQLDDIVAGIDAAAAVSKQHRIEREKQQEEWRRQEQLRSRERERIRFLDEKSSQWERWSRRRSFLNAMRERLVVEKSSQDLRDWFEWAERYVAETDPFEFTSDEAALMSERESELES